jgi:hypothetical protein
MYGDVERLRLARAGAAGRGNLRSFVVVIVLGIVAQMTLKGLIAPARIAMVQASQTTTSVNSVPVLLSGLSQRNHGACWRLPSSARR